MRRSSSTTSRCGASSARAAVAGAFMALGGSRPRRSGAIGLPDQPQHVLAAIGLEHGDEKLPRGLLRLRRQAVERAQDTARLQAGELQRQRLAFRRNVEQPLSAVALSLFLHDISLI